MLLFIHSKQLKRMGFNTKSLLNTFLGRLISFLSAKRLRKKRHLIGSGCFLGFKLHQNGLKLSVSVCCVCYQGGCTLGEMQYSQLYNALIVACGSKSQSPLITVSVRGRGFCQFMVMSGKLNGCVITHELSKVGCR